jgi:hypothetical protein
MVLYARDWRRIGTRYEFRDTLAQITGIEVEYLCGDKPLNTASVSRRMSWASTRNTSRIEDTAYCLLGLFDVHMPLLYGEGKKAFRRLQEEILKANPADHTLLAWGTLVSQPRSQVSDPLQSNGIKPIPWDAHEASRTLQGLFAESPRDFRNSGDIYPWEGARGFYSSAQRGSRAVSYPSVNGAGVGLELSILAERSGWSVHHWLHPPVTQLRHLIFIVLLCRIDHPKPGFILLPLHSWGYDQLARTDELMLLQQHYGIGWFLQTMQWLQVEPEILPNLRPGDCLLRFWGTGYFSVYYADSALWIRGDCIIRAPVTSMPVWLAAMHYGLAKRDTMFGFSIVFGRGVPVGTTVGPVTVSLVPVLINQPKTEDSMTIGGFTWTHRSHIRLNSLGSLPVFQHSMKLPEDQWRVDLTPFPRIQVHVKRMSCGPLATDLFDMVDVTVLHEDA